VKNGAILKATLRSEASLIRCFRDQPRLTRLEIQDATGLSRVTVSQRIQKLVEEKVLLETDAIASSGGRKATALTLNPNGGFIGIVDFAATTFSIALANLHGEVIQNITTRIDISDGPKKLLPEAITQIKEIYSSVPKSKRLGVVVGVPGPVDHTKGKVVSPPIMQGWDSIDFIEVFEKELATPIYLENDANLIAFAEWKLIYPEVRDMMVVKLGTGIGSGIILNKRLHRGADGAAGDIGHVQLDALKGSLCRCGHTDCVESFSGGWALVEKINAMGYKVKDTTDIVELCRKGDAKIIRLLTEASSYIGHAIADAVNLLNPSKVVIEGRLVNATDLVLATIKEVVYQRAGALATKKLDIVPAQLGTDCAVLGAAQLGVDRFFYGILDN
jgi:predicted NBD/HSP70 family sugar kinase